MDRENMRIIISKRMIREGLLRCLQKKSIDEITITELCREAQVNRTTFYNHYEVPKDVLDEISWEIVGQIEDIYTTDQPIRDCTVKALNILQENRDLLKTLFSANVSSATANIVIQTTQHFWKTLLDKKNTFNLDEDETKLMITGYGWAGYHMIRQWILEDIDKTPEEILDLFNKIFGNR